MPQCPTNLSGEFVVQAVDEIADVVGDVAKVQILPPPVARVENLLEILTGGDNRLIIGQWAMAELVGCRNLSVGLDDPLGQIGELFLKANVGGHDAGSCRQNIPESTDHGISSPFDPFDRQS